MTAWVRLGALVLLAGLALLGLAGGAATQREVFLESDLTAAQQAAEGADSNLIILTAFPVAVGGAGLAVALSRRPPLQRVGPTITLAAALYLLVNLAQGSWPNYNAFPAGRTADLSNTLLAANLDATPSVLIPVLAIVAGLLAAILWSLGRLLAREPSDTANGPAKCLRRHIAILATTSPFFLVAILGTLRLLIGLPGDQPGAGPYFVLLPACILACAGLLGLGLAKAWQLGIWVRNGRLAASVQDAWQALGRAEAVLASVLAGLAVAGSFLAEIDRPDLHLGRTLSVTMRSHTQFLAFLLIPMIQSLGLHRDARRSLETAPAHGASLESGPHPLAGAALGATLVGLGLAGLATFLGEAALWPWVAAALPLAALASLGATAKQAAHSGYLVCYIVWAIGNTVVANYDGNQEGVLRFEVPAGVLALLRTLAVLASAAITVRLLHGLGQDRPGVAVPLATGAGASIGMVALLVMPLWAWLTPRAGTDALAVGSLLASMDPAVRASIHVVASILSVAAALLLARLMRPDWFGAGKPPPLAAATRAKARPTA